MRQRAGQLPAARPPASRQRLVFPPGHSRPGITPGQISVNGLRQHLGLGKLYRRTGRSDEARAELATAVAMLSEMGMAFWLPKTERALAQADGSVVG